MREAIDLDAADLRLLAALQENGRLTNQELAARVRLSASQCSRRRARLEAAGLLRGYRAVLDPAALGLEIVVFVNVTLATHSRDNARRFRDLVVGLDAVLEAHALTGDPDYLLKLVVPRLADLSRIVSDVLLPHESVAQVRSQIVLETLKADAPLPLPRAGSG